MMISTIIINYIKWGFESRLKQYLKYLLLFEDYIKWGFESRLKRYLFSFFKHFNYIKWGFESRLKHIFLAFSNTSIISNGDLRVD